MSAKKRQAKSLLAALQTSAAQIRRGEVSSLAALKAIRNRRRTSDVKPRRRRARQKSR